MAWLGWESLVKLW